MTNPLMYPSHVSMDGRLTKQPFKLLYLYKPRQFPFDKDNAVVHLSYLRQVFARRYLEKKQSRRIQSNPASIIAWLYSPSYLVYENLAQNFWYLVSRTCEL